MEKSNIKEPTEEMIDVKVLVELGIHLSELLNNDTGKLHFGHDHLEELWKAIRRIKKQQ